MQQKKFYFGTHREQADGLDVPECSMVSQDPSLYLSECDSVVLTNHIYNFSLLFGCESVCSSSTVWFSFSPAKYKYCEHTVFY